MQQQEGRDIGVCVAISQTADTAPPGVGTDQPTEDPHHWGILMLVWHSRQRGPLALIVQLLAVQIPSSSIYTVLPKSTTKCFLLAKLPPGRTVESRRTCQQDQPPGLERRVPPALTCLSRSVLAVAPQTTLRRWPPNDCSGALQQLIRSVCAPGSSLWNQLPAGHVA